MLETKTYYIIDTNVIVDYVDIIPNGSKTPPENPTVDLSNAHLIIPTAVVRELSSFKKEIYSDRGKAARVALRRIRKLAEGNNFDMDKVYDLNNPIRLSSGARTLSILPIRKDFCEKLPFLPADDDMDGQIILAALTAIEKAENDNVVLLTNDNGLAIRAKARGITTNRYGYKQPPVYTGRRDLVIPDKLFEQFVNEKVISLEDWKAAMPKEKDLVANEFIVMKPAGDKYQPGYNPELEKFSNIGRYDATEKAIVSLQYIRDFPVGLHNAGQAIYAEALANPDIDVVICTGPAGTGKTYMAAIYSYLACKDEGNFIGITVVPCQIENDGIGFLPGDIDEKLDPNIQPIKNALRNYLLSNDKDFRKVISNKKSFSKKEECGERDSDKQKNKSIKARLKDNVNLIWDNWFGEPIPIAYARGRDFSHEIVIYDEFQDQNRTQADTLLKRLGEDSKMIITGDIEQIHAAYLDQTNNGLVYARHLLMDDPRVAQVTFTEQEVVRHSLVRTIAERQKTPAAE